MFFISFDIWWFQLIPPSSRLSSNKHIILGKKWSFQELEQMDYQEYLNVFFEEIPSGSESEISDNEDIGEESEHDNAQYLIDQSNNTESLIDSNINDNFIQVNNDDFSDEDLIPLSEVQAELNKNKFVWWNQVINYTAPADFNEDYGPRNIPENVELPIEVFLCLYPETLFEDIAYQTNLYATQCSSRTGKAFMPTNAGEIKTFFAINIMMGIKRLPSYRDFWSTKVELRDNYISSLMARTRFDWLLGNFHMNNNVLQPKRGDQDYDKLYKVRPYLTKLSETFSTYYAPTKSISIDESMILFKGRSSLRQYMPNKPVKRGYKIWVRASASGYIDEFQIYTGKVGNVSEKQLGPRVVMDLTRSLVGHNHHVYFDNYFTSLPLLRELKKAHVNACGTIRKNRVGAPNDLKTDKNMARGESDWRITEDGICFIKWMDKRAVLLGSNFHRPDVAGTVERKKKGRREGSNSVSCDSKRL